MSAKVVCNICGQVVDVRKSSSMGAFPVSHRRVGHVDKCHGFYVASNNFPQEEEK